MFKMSSKPNLSQLDKWAENLNNNIPGDTKSLFKDLSKETSKEVKKVFETEGYGRWAKARKKRNPRLPLLIDTKKMIRASTAYTKASSIEDNKLIYGLDLSDFAEEYPKKHEEGLGNVPKRSIWGLVANNDEFKQRVYKISQEWFSDKIEKEAKKYFGK